MLQSFQAYRRVRICEETSTEGNLAGAIMICTFLLILVEGESNCYSLDLISLIYAGEGKSIPV